MYVFVGVSVSASVGICVEVWVAAGVAVDATDCNDNPALVNSTSANNSTKTKKRVGWRVFWQKRMFLCIPDSPMDCSTAL